MDDILLAQEIDAAIRQEEEAAAFYAAAAEATDNPSGAAMFRELAALERSHRAHLVTLREAVAKGGGWVAYGGGNAPGGKVAACAATQGAASGDACGHADAVAALRTALAAEESAEAHYRKLAQAVTDEVGRAAFLRMAEEEATHRRLLDDQIYALSNRGVWLWGD